MRKRGFTLIELIVVMAILAILVLFGIPKYKEYTKEAQLTKIRVNVKELESASMQYYMKNNYWPRLSDEPYTAEQIENFGESILDKTGAVVVLEEDGKYYDIDFSKIDNYIKLPDDNINYILQNPVGKVLFIEGMTEEGKVRVKDGIIQDNNVYILATNEDFSGEKDGEFKYIGTAEYVEVPNVIKGVPITSYSSMFSSTNVKGVKSTNKNVTNMSWMFFNSNANLLDLRSLDTSNVTSMSYMFRKSKATELNLSSFDTSNVTLMIEMFKESGVVKLDLSNFDTSNVTDMRGMLSYLNVDVLDLSDFDISKVIETNMSTMFYESNTTTCYVRNSSDLSKFKNSAYVPSGLTFIVK